MNVEDKIKLNKLIRNYKGDNTFILSLQKQLKSSKYLNKIEHNDRSIKILSEKQYKIANEIMQKSIYN
jgi:hypothetical protein